MHPNNEFKQHQELKTAIAKIASEDSNFRTALIENPKDTIAALLQIEPRLLGDLDVEVAIEEPGKLILVVPSNIQDTELSDTQLDQVAGGSHWLTNMTWPPGKGTRFPWRPSDFSFNFEEIKWN